MSGARAALFDMDKTLVRVNTGSLYVRWRMRRGESGFADMARVSWWTLQYTFGLVDAEAVSRYGARVLAGRDEAAFAEECEEWYRTMVRPYVTEAARREVSRRRGEGLVTAIVTGSSPYGAMPLAAELGIDHVVASQLRVHEGRFTGEVEPPLCFGVGKVQRAERWAAEHGIDLARCVFYSDSLSDLPMLERVAEARVINPDPRLARIARKRGWPVEHWR